MAEGRQGGQTGAGRPVILLINDEYGTSKGGISTMNCQASQTLTSNGAVVYATVLQLNVPKQDQEAADRDKVKLIKPYRKVGDTREPSMDWLTFDYTVRYPKSALPPHVNVIIGHADVTDMAARNIHDEYYKEADLIMFTHVLPEDTEYFKGGQKAMGASKKEDAMLSQVHNAKAAFSVGHRIFKHFKNKYRGAKKPREHHLFLPRPSKIFEEVNIQPDTGEGELVVLSIGRVKNVENLKGYNLEARAIGIAVQKLKFRWIARGISEDDWEESMKILVDNLNSPFLKPTLRPYGTQEDIRNDMMMAHLVLMLSRSEPFGLVGLEAIAAGIPVLISDQSGLADMINKLVAEEKLPRGLLNRIVETSVQDSDMDKTAEKWADKIRDTLTDTKAAFRDAKEFKDALLKSKYWEGSERVFLEACGITGSPEEMKPKVPGEAGVSQTTQHPRGELTPTAGNGEPSSQKEMEKRQPQVSSREAGRASFQPSSQPQVSSGSFSESVRFTIDVQEPAVESLPCFVTVTTNKADLTGGKVAPQTEVTSPQGKTTLIQTTAHTSPPLAAGKGQTSRVSRVWGAEWRPQQSGKHTLGVCMGGTKDLCSLTVGVGSNNPVLRFGQLGSQQGQFDRPADVAVRGDRLYVADSDNDRVQVFDLSGKFCSSFPAASPSGKFCLSFSVNPGPAGLAVQTDGTIVVNSEREVRKFSPSGELLHKFPLSEYCTNPLYGLAVQRDGRVVVADSGKHRIFLFEADGTLVKQVGGQGKGEGQFYMPLFVCVDKEDNIIVADTNNHRVQVFDRNLNYKHKFGQYGRQPQNMFAPSGVSADSRGNIVLANIGGITDGVEQGKKLQVFRPDGTWVSTISSDGDKLNEPHGVAVTEDGHVFVADFDDHCIRKYRYM